MKKILATSLVTLLVVGCGTAVDPQIVASIEVTPSSLSLVVREEATLSAVAKDAAGNPVSVTFKWRTSNGEVASVSSEGVVTGWSVCLARVTAHVGLVPSNVVVVTVTDMGASANSAESAACGG